jgi:GNAT superfamily N-acetyltransferase
MFFEKINTEGQSRPRFESVNFKYVIYKNLDSQTTQDLMLLAKSYFTDFNESDLSTRLSDKKNILFLLVFAPVKDSDSKLVGFKIGFEKTDDTYYSWLGAVARDYKNLGIARELIKQQVMWCETMGYKFLETKTTNKWKEMLMLNLKSGFEITGTEFDSKKELKISLRKKI